MGAQFPTAIPRSGGQTSTQKGMDPFYDTIPAMKVKTKITRTSWKINGKHQYPVEGLDRVWRSAIGIGREPCN